MHEIIVEKDCSIFELLSHHFPESSKNSLRSWLEKGRVALQGQTVKKTNHPVKKGERVTIGHKATFLRREIKVLFEDKHLVVIEKPEGLLSVNTDSGSEPSAHEILKRRFHTQRVYPVHRLDQGTSGVMLFAYNEQAEAHLKKQFEEHTIEREYVAIVEGVVKEAKGTWKSMLSEDENYFVKSGRFGKLGITHYAVEEVGKGCTLLRFKLETGRKNQIRVHCQEAGHPVVGDKKYGKNKYSAKRLCLHAMKLGFIHPKSEEKLSFVSPLPDSFIRERDRLL